MSSKAILAKIFSAQPSLRTRGFLPKHDPLTAFPKDSPMSVLDQYGSELPDQLMQDDFRSWMDSLEVPFFLPSTEDPDEQLREMHLYYVRTASMVSGYVHQIGHPIATRIPYNWAWPLVDICSHLRMRPILSYVGYGPWNWYRKDPSKGIEVDNLHTIQNFVKLYDETWFAIVHVPIEAIFARSLDMLARYAEGDAGIDSYLITTHDALREMSNVLRRIPEHMSSDLYFFKFRPYIMGFFEPGVVYEGVSDKPKIFRGETGAQSSFMPLLEALLKIPHASDNGLVPVLRDMRNYMPIGHRQLLQAADIYPDVRADASREAWNACLEAIAEFRSIHLGWAKEYIDRHGDGRGTGGSPYIRWLGGLRDDALAYRK